MVPFQIESTQMNSCFFWSVRFSVAVCILTLASRVATFADESRTPNSDADGDPAGQFEKLNQEVIASLARQLKEKETVDPEATNAVDQYSTRGDLLMFLGQFEKAEADYLAMVKLKPDLDTSHWRLGIAMYFADHPKLAAEQFDKYDSFDNVDRENGIWRYFSHYRAFGREEARRQLLRYEKDDRPPFKEVYQLFDGTLTSEGVLKAIPENVPASSRESRLFYSHLYIGLNQAVEGRTDEAKISLRTATLNSWPRSAGFGPNYMWHVGRLQYLELQKTKSAKE